MQVLYVEHVEENGSRKGESTIWQLTMWQMRSRSFHNINMKHWHIDGNFTKQSHFNSVSHKKARNKADYFYWKEKLCCL